MRLHWVRAVWRAASIAATVVLIVAAGLCLFDVDHAGAGDHVMSLDPCLGMLVASVAAPGVARLTQTGCVVATTNATALVVVLSVPAPPPKLGSAL